MEPLKLRTQTYIEEKILPNGYRILSHITSHLPESGLRPRNTSVRCGAIPSRNISWTFGHVPSKRECRTRVHIFLPFLVGKPRKLFNTARAVADSVPRCVRSSTKYAVLRDDALYGKASQLLLQLLSPAPRGSQARTEDIGECAEAYNWNLSKSYGSTCSVDAQTKRPSYRSPMVDRPGINFVDLSVSIRSNSG